LVTNTSLPAGTLIWPVLSKIDSNDLLRLISPQFFNYQNFSTLFITNPSTNIFLLFFAEWKKGLLLHTQTRRDGRVVDCGGLENRCTVRYRGFESLSLRKDTGVAQSVEHWSPKPGVGRSSRSSRAFSPLAQLSFFQFCFNCLRISTIQPTGKKRKIKQIFVFK
jgi:hypothetical protein